MLHEWNWPLNRESSKNLTPSIDLCKLYSRIDFGSIRTVDKNNLGSGKAM